MTARYARLTQPEPYRATGTNTLGLAVVIQTLKPKAKPARLKRKVAVHG